MTAIVKFKPTCRIGDCALSHVVSELLAACGQSESHLRHLVDQDHCHRLRGSASTVLTTTGQVNGRW